MTDKAIQYLNLDDVEPSVQKVLTIKGKSYEFKQPSVGEFVNEMKRIKTLQSQFEGEDADQFDVLEAMIDSQKHSVKNAFPTIPEKVLNDLTNDQLGAIRTFIEKQFDKENEDAQDEAGNAPAAGTESKP